MAELFHYHPTSGAYQGSTEISVDPEAEDLTLPKHTTLIAPPDEEDGKIRRFVDGAWQQVELADLFHYHPTSGEYRGQTKARPDPITGDPMIPGYATLAAPPEKQDGKARVFNNGAWSQPEDHRGEVYWTGDGAKHVVEDFGPMPDAALDKAPSQTLDERKEEAIAEARGIANDIRRKVAESASTPRALSWVNKVPYAAFWKLHEDGGDPNGPFAALAATAEAGFQIEADVKGTTAEALRDRTLAKNDKFFRATQLVEGMEGLAETVIPAAVDEAKLEEAITHLQTLQAQAMVQLKAITSA